MKNTIEEKSRDLPTNSCKLWGDPNEDLPTKPRYLVTFTVGIGQTKNIGAAVKKILNISFSFCGCSLRTLQFCFFIMMARLVNETNLGGQSVWYAKRFPHPDILASYDYIFIWDEDLGVEHFNADRYIELVKKHGLVISQPGLEPDKRLTWQMTKRRGDSEVHRETEEKPGWSSDLHLPPCAAYV
ncbi:hypothetical protein MKX01_026636 [Papaver californicum]|nr:hypothetical protein MKX01_026636 [Papaver californicum]